MQQTQTPEMELHEDILKEVHGQPTKEQNESARVTGSTEEVEAHVDEMEKPQKERTKPSEDIAKSTSQKTQAGTPGNASGHPKSVDGEIAKRNIAKGKFGLLGGLALGGGALMDFNSRKKDGDTNLEAVVGTSANTAVAAFVGPWLALGYVAGKEGLGGIVEGGKSLMAKTREINRIGTASPFAYNNFIETRDTFTMRQAAMAAIGQARGNLENVMAGNEANLLHR